MVFEPSKDFTKRSEPPSNRYERSSYWIFIGFCALIIWNLNGVALGVLGLNRGVSPIIGLACLYLLKPTRNLSGGRYPISLVVYFLFGALFVLIALTVGYFAA